MKKLLLLLMLFVCGGAYASHIVGGELFYECTGNGNYHVTLKLYRDCACTNCAPFGNPEYLSIFNAQGGLVTQVAMPFPGSNQLSATVSSPCLTPPTVCIEQAVYTADVNLPDITGGYTIVYQRCCRNQGVTNIVSQLGNTQGATYTANIPDPSFAQCNKSARFNSLPPIFLCVNSPVIIDYSATDPDGDQLVYSLCDPYDGADNTCPDPSPNNTQPGCPTSASSPPYNSISYNTPYSSTNFTNDPSNNNNFTIDPQTGVLTGTPNNVGIYDVTVCVSEYRNGHLIGTLRRDFQFNIDNCNIPIANIPSTNINPSTGIGTYVLQCSNFTVTFQNNTFNPDPTVPLLYSWDFGVPGSTTDTSSAQFPTFTYPDTGVYLVRLIAVKQNTNPPCGDTTYAYVKVYPTFSTAFGNTNVCEDHASVFVDSTTSTYGVTNQWLWNFGDGSTSTQQNPLHTYSSAGTYNVTLSDRNNLGCAGSKQKTVTVFAAPVANFTASVACINVPVSFTNTSTGNISSTLWDFGANGATSSQQNPTYTYNTAGIYTVSLILQSPDGCIDTNAQSLTVHPQPVINLSNDTTICPYTSAQLSASGGVTYAWTPVTYLNNPNIANPVATPVPPASITYVVNVTDQFQCTNTGSVTVSFHPIPQIDAGLDTSVCLNPGSFRDSVQLHATGGVSYQWSPPTGLTATNIANPVSRPPGNTTYYLLGTDVNGCMLTDSVTVLVLDPSLNLILENMISICQRDTGYATIVNQGVSSYSWTSSQYLTDPSSFNTGFDPPDTTNFILTVANYCYTKSDSLLVIVWPIPVLGLNPLDSICNGDSIQLNAQNATTYQWNADPTLSNTSIPNPVASPIVTTKYIVTGTNQYGCVNKDSTTIDVYYPSVIHVYPDTPFICLGTSAQLNATGAYTYVWTPAASLSNANIANPVATPADTTKYNVVATNVHGCKSYDSLVINVQLPVTALAQSPYNACQGIPLQLQASGGFYYEWTPHAGLNNPFISNPFATPDSTTNYYVKVSNDCFTDSALVQVVIHQLPFVDAGPDTLIYRDTYAQLNGFTNETNHFWNPSTWLDDPFNLGTKAEPQQSTWYELFAIDQYGCMNKDSVFITVASYNVMDIPTAFSPNGDGVNDVFHIVRHLNIDHLKEFDIFNRWGQKVFSTENIAQGWDGTMNGIAQPIGVYSWVVVAETKDQKEIIRKGNVTLIR